LDKKLIEHTLESLYASNVKERKFDESIELILTFKNLNIKNKDHRFDFIVNIPHPYLKKVRSFIFIKDKTLAESLKGIVDKIVFDEEIPKMKKTEVKKLTTEYDVFLAEGPVMLTVGKYLGQALSPRGKMPIIAPPNPNAIKALIDAYPSKLKVSNVKNKSSVAIQLKIGKKSQAKNDIADNVMTVYNALIEKLPAGKHNIKYMALKTTMSTIQKVGDKE